MSTSAYHKLHVAPGTSYALCNPDIAAGGWTLPLEELSAFVQTHECEGVYTDVFKPYSGIAVTVIDKNLKVLKEQRWVCHFKDCKFQLSKSHAKTKRKCEHIAAHIASGECYGTHKPAHEQCGFCGSTSPYCKIAVRSSKVYADCGRGMVGSKPTLKHLMAYANGIRECSLCRKYYWLLNTNDHYQNQHPGKPVPQVDEGTVNKLQKKLITDQNVKTRKRKGR